MNQVRPRSGLAIKHGITCLKACTTDSDYRGEVGVILINLSDTPFTITRAMRMRNWSLHLLPNCMARSFALDDTARGMGDLAQPGCKFGFWLCDPCGYTGVIN